MSLSERIQQLNREISATVERALTDLRQEIGQRLRASNDEVQRRLDELVPVLPDSFLSHEDLLPAAERELGPGTRRNALRDLRDGVAVIDRARSQADILNALLRESLRYASRAVVLLNRGGELRGWGSQGFGDADAALRELSLSASPDSVWGRLAQGEGASRLSAAECAELCSRVESPAPRVGASVPVILRMGRPVPGQDRVHRAGIPAVPAPRGRHPVPGQPVREWSVVFDDDAQRTDPEAREAARQKLADLIRADQPG